MTDKQIRVGDVVAWSEVPSGALVMVSNDFALRLGDLGHWVCLRGELKMDWARVGPWGGWTYDDGEVVDEGPSTIIALDVPADATAEHLRELAEVFEVREMLDAERVSSEEFPSWWHIKFGDAVVLRTGGGDTFGRADALDAAAEHLHRVYGVRAQTIADDVKRLTEAA